MFVLPHRRRPLGARRRHGRRARAARRRRAGRVVAAFDRHRPRRLCVLRSVRKPTSHLQDRIKTRRLPRRFHAPPPPLAVPASHIGAAKMAPPKRLEASAATAAAENRRAEGRTAGRTAAALVADGYYADPDAAPTPRHADADPEPSRRPRASTPGPRPRVCKFPRRPGGRVYAGLFPMPAPASDPTATRASTAAPARLRLARVERASAASPRATCWRSRPRRRGCPQVRAPTRRRRSGALQLLLRVADCRRGIGPR